MQALTNHWFDPKQLTGKARGASQKYQPAILPLELAFPTISYHREPSDGTHVDALCMPGEFPCHSGNMQRLFLGLRVLPLLLQAAPAQQHRPEQFPHPWEVRMWCRPAPAWGKCIGGLQLVGHMGKTELRNMGCHSSEETICRRMETLRMHRASRISVVQNAIEPSFCS